MADLEAVLADVSYLMAMEKSKSTPAASASKKIVLPDRRYDIQHIFFRCLFSPEKDRYLLSNAVFKSSFRENSFSVLTSNRT
jgi:hypothetical protein